MSCLTRLSKICEDVIRMNVDAKSEKKERCSDQETRIVEPVIGVTSHSDKILTLHVTIHRAKHES